MRKSLAIAILIFFTEVEALENLVGTIGVTDVVKSYQNQRSKMNDMLESLKKTKEAYQRVSVAVATAENKQLEVESMTETASDATIKLGSQSSAFVRAEILRGESMLIKNKEVVVDIWIRSQEISKEEIVELKKETGL